MGALLLCTAGSRSVSACAGVSAPERLIRVVDESAVIVWDATQHQERFIRRATFDTNAENFGFLVPTPSQPTLREANDAVFPVLERIIQPRVIVQQQFEFKLGALLFWPMDALTPITHGMGASEVEVLETRHVAGYDAVVLSADNAVALQTWLRSHGYAAQPELLTWLAPYIKAHWKITAFKISKVNSYAARTSSTAVEMAFTTDHPFFPYREPANQRAPGHYAPRSLRVFLLSADRMEGRLGESVSPASWPGKLFSANPLPQNPRQILEKTLTIPSQQFPKQLWLTTFEDRSFPRPGTEEVYFAPAAQQTPVAPTPVTVVRVKYIVLPLELCAPLTGALVCLRLKRHRRRFGHARRQ